MGGEPRPHAVEGAGQFGHPADLAGEVVEVELVVAELGRVLVPRERGDRRCPDTEPLLGLAGPVGEHLGHRLLDQASASVVGARAPAGALHDAPGVLGGQAQDEGPVGHLEVGGQRTLPGPHGAGHHLGHPDVPLEPGHLGGAVLPDPDLGDQPRHRREGHPGLPQGRQDLLDVAQEQRVGADHQDALALEGETVRVEEVGGAVQGHRRLAGPRPALDHEHPAERGPDDLVLLGLDGRDDVGHPPRPGPVQGGQQRRRAPDGQVADDQFAGAVRSRNGAVLGGHGVDDRTGHAEPLVLDADHGASLEGQVAPQHETERVATGRPVERLGHRRPPVDHQRFVVGTVDGQPTDVEGLAVRSRPRRRRRHRSAGRCGRR